MDKELKAKWVAALRSGRYEQARQAFREGDGFCCLGVLADICEKGEWDERVYVINNNATDEVELDGDLGPYGRPLFGMDEKTEKHLIRLNDDDGADFCQIADYIETAL